MPRKVVAEDKLHEALGMIKAGKSQREVAKALKISKSCVQRLNSRYKSTGSVKHRWGGGPSRKTNSKDDRVIKRIAIKHRKKSFRAILGEVKRSGIDISLGTLASRLSEMGLEKKPTKKRQLLTKKHKINRVKFCKKYRDWTLEDWKKVMFSDESNFKPFQRKNNQTVWFRTGIDREEE